MKKSKLAIVAAATIVVQLIVAHAVNAQPFYKASVDADGVTTSSAGKLTYSELDNRSLIRACAAEQGITNLTGLSLVYDRTADAIQVVSGTNNTLVCTPLTFAGGVSLSNTNGTELHRLTGVYWETNLVASGSLVTGELDIPATTNHAAVYNLNGKLQFVVPANGTNAAVIYVGSVSTGTPCGNSRDSRDSRDSRGNSRH